jgi:hypothetical protein
MRKPSHKYDVYAIVDPRNNLPIYIGKGKVSNKRMYDHWRLMTRGCDRRNPKLYNKLTKIFLAGYRAPIYKILLRTNDQTLAYAMEAFWITVIGRENLCNLKEGGSRGKLNQDNAPKGEQSYHAKLTENQVLAIRQDTRKVRQIAIAYCISYSTVTAIKQRRTWKHLLGDAIQVTRKALTKKEVLSIRVDERYCTEIAKAYGIPYTTVRSIKSGENWKNLEGGVVMNKQNHRGENNNSVKLSERDVIAIRSDRRPASAIGKNYNVSKTCVFNIKSGKTWSHVVTL